MFNKKNYVLNCDLCDTRKIKEEDYSGFEKILVNADVIVVNETSKSILSRLPFTINQDCMIEIPDGVDANLQTINGSYEISGTTAVIEHTVLVVNGELIIKSGAESVMEKYERIHVNGSVRCPKSLEGNLSKLTANGSVTLFPDDCVVLENTFAIDKYFPLRAKENGKYYIKDEVIIQDRVVELEKLVRKNVQFVTKKLIVPEEMIESAVALFDETVIFEVIPEGMTLIYGDAVLNDDLVEKNGRKIYVYGSLKIDENCNLKDIAAKVDKLIIKDAVTLKKNQEELFRELKAEYHSIKFVWEGRIIENKPSARIDTTLLESSPNKVLVRNAAVIKVAEDVTPELILDRLMIENCAKVSCTEEQESAIAAIAQNVAKIGGTGDGNEGMGLMDGMKELLSTKIVNADTYIM